MVRQVVSRGGRLPEYKKRKKHPRRNLKHKKKSLKESKKTYD